MVMISQLPCSIMKDWKNMFFILDHICHFVQDSQVCKYVQLLCPSRKLRLLMHWPASVIFYTHLIQAGIEEMNWLWDPCAAFAWQQKLTFFTVWLWHAIWTVLPLLQSPSFRYDALPPSNDKAYNSDNSSPSNQNPVWPIMPFSS